MATEIWISAALLIAFGLSLESGFRLGRWATQHREAPSGNQAGAIQAAVLGLLGLLLGFSFAGAGSRFLERQDLIVSEANAIGTAYLRADMLDEPFRSTLRDALAGYVRHRLELVATLHQGLAPEAVDQVSAFHDQIWKAASEGVNAKPASMMVVLPPVNDVIDLHASRVAAGRKHLPGLVMGLLILCSSLGVAVIGYGCGLSRRRCLPMTASLSILISAALWTTIDLDHPRAGLIRLDDSPLRELTFSNAN